MSRHQALDTFGRSGNPVFGNKFDGDAQFRDLPVAQKMTLDGTVIKLESFYLCASQLQLSAGTFLILH